MTVFELPDTKDFMNKLLLTQIFDHFCLVEATIATGQTVIIDGKINADFYSSEELASLPPFQRWEKMKPFCLQWIKGDRTPMHFKITLTLSPDNIENVLQASRLDYSLSQIKGLLLNLKFDGNKLFCTTGISWNIFTMDKRLEQEWDSLTSLFFKKHQIISTRVS